MPILVVNAGSSSVKLRMVGDDDTLLASTDRPLPPASELAPVLAEFLESHPEVDAAGHRIVHGGSRFESPVVLDAETDEVLAELSDLAPLHNPIGVAAVRTLRSLRPGLAQVACFDTSFHLGMPAKAHTYAVPPAWRREWGIRRFGFHGLSHAWASRRAGELLGRPPTDLRLVTAHLGSGASLAAVAGGRSVDTTMGFTPMEGLVMATRSGTVDPGAVLWVQRHRGLSPEGVEDALEHRSGLAGLSECSGDLRQVLTAVDAGDAPAHLAYEVYVYRLQTGIGAMAAAMNGTDGLVFTGGAGEGSSRLRADACRGLTYLGLEVDEASNRSGAGDRRISGAAGPAVLVVQAREDLEIARHVRTLLGGRAAGGGTSTPGPT